MNRTNPVTPWLQIIILIYYFRIVIVTARKLIIRIRTMIVFFVTTLILSGITAFPVYSELKWITEQHIFPANSLIGAWILKVWYGVSFVNDQHAFFYGYDWLAFAHIVIALAFIAPYKDPVKNKWIIDWAITFLYLHSTTGCNCRANTRYTLVSYPYWLFVWNYWDCSALNHAEMD